MEGHDSSGLRGLASPGREIGVAAHNDVLVHCQVLQLELIKDIGLVFFERVVAQKELASHENREIEHRIEPG